MPACIHSGYYYSASSSLLLLRGAPDTAWVLCWSFTPKRHRQLLVKDLPKVPTWRLEWDLNLWPFGRKATNLPMSHHSPQYGFYLSFYLPVCHVRVTVCSLADTLKVM